MPSVIQLVVWEIQGFIVTLAAIIAGQLFTGQINTRNLLYGRKSNAGQPIFDADGNKIGLRKENSLYFSPERVQLLLFTVSAGLYYLTQVMNKPGTLPDVPSSWTTAMGGSNAIYLGGKALARFWPGNDMPTGSANSSGE
jgi:hypothetical protein